MPATESAPCRHLTQSKALRLPRKTMETSKVLRLPQKLQRIFGKRRKSTAPATRNNFGYVITKHVWMSRTQKLWLG